MNLREALDVPVWQKRPKSNEYGERDAHDEARRVERAAARRFLALTETGPDYEAAARAWMEEWGTEYEVEDVELVRPIVDAALADYLTESRQ